jgi:Uma2 family endonuclease
MAQPPISSPGPGPRRPATVADWEAVPAPYTAHLIAGNLEVLPKPMPRHAHAQGQLFGELNGPFNRKRGGPGGWLFLQEVDIRLGSDIVSPDIAGWRRERLPGVPDATPITLAPDWVCEVLSPRTETFDRGGKAGWYAAAGVDWLWFVDPEARTLEAYKRDGTAWRPIGTWRGDADVAAPPFDAVTWPLAALWG